MRKLLLALLLAAAAVLGGRAVTNQPPERISGTVIRVVDGDTLHVQVRQRDETVRLLGIDTPESHRPGTPVECGARGATRALEALASGRRVRLVSDPTQDKRDRYGRRLAYVMLRGSGTDLGELMVRRGWAEVYVFERPFERVARYRAAAKRAQGGVLARCGGDFHSAS